MIKKVLIALCILGIGLSLYLTYAKITSSPLYCGFGNCEKVQLSRYSEIAGIPVSVFGIAYYFVLLSLFYYSAKKKWLNLLLVWGILFSTYLTYLELFVIKAICMWCVVSFVNIVIISAIYKIKYK